MRLPPWLQRALRAPFAWIAAAFVVACVVGATWGLPCTESWSADAVSPRAAGLGAVAETWWPGHYFRHPPLHLMALTLLAVPWIVAATLRTDGSLDAVARELLEPRYMTPVEVAARLVTLAMAVGLLWNVRRLWARLAGERASLLAAAVVALNPVLVFYAHTGNLDVPGLFWVTLALVELDRVIAGEGRERHALLAVAAAALTRDQAAGPFALAAPYALWVAPLAARARAPAGLRPPLVAVLLRRRLLVALGWAAGAWLALAGVVTNPTGFARRVGYLRDTVARDRALFDEGLAGFALRALAAAPAYTSPTLGLAALAGLALVVARARGASRVRMLLPAVAALSATLFVNLPARWTLDRHLLPQSVLLAPYAGVALDAALRWVGDRGRAPGLALVGVLLVTPALDVASVDATLLADARPAAERLLASLPRGARVEVYGGAMHLPRLPRHLAVTRVGPDPVAGRSPLPGVAEREAPYGDVARRAPAWVVVPSNLARHHPAARGLVRGLADGSLGYAWALRSRCAVPAPLRCVTVHGATGGETWVFRRAAPGGS